MIILPISDDLNQTFSFNAEYNTSIHIKCAEANCNGQVYPPVMDVYISGSSPIYGLPLIPSIDLLEEHVASRCIPYDYGALMVFGNEDIVTCEGLASGESFLVYLNAAEIVFALISLG